MFSVFTDGRQREADADAKHLQALQEKDEKESEQRRIQMEKARDAELMRQTQGPRTLAKPDAKQKSKYVLEEEDWETEDKIADIQSQLYEGTVLAKQKAIGFGFQIEHSIGNATRLTEAVSRLEIHFSASVNQLTIFTDRPCPRWCVRVAQSSSPDRLMEQLLSVSWTSYVGHVSLTYHVLPVL